MAKKMLPLAVRFITRSAVVDGTIFGEDGDFWEAWRAPAIGGWWGRRLYQATVYPLCANAPSFTSPVVAVDSGDFLVAGVSDPAAVASACTITNRYKHRTAATVLAGRLSISGTVCNLIEALVDDGKQREHGFEGESLMLDATVRSLDSTYPFETRLPFAILGPRALDVVARTG